jgi:hypothetical protein
MNKILMRYDEQGAKTELRKFEQDGQPVLQSLVDHFKEMDLGQIKSMDELKELLISPKAFVIRRMNPGKDVNFSGIPLDPEKLFDLLQSPPKGFLALQFAIKDYREQAAGMGANYVDLGAFEIVKGSVILSDAKRKDIEENHKRYAETDRQKALYLTGQQIQAILQELGQQYADAPALLLEKIIKAKNESVTIEITHI